MNSAYRMRLLTYLPIFTLALGAFAASSAGATELANSIQFRSPVDGQTVRPGETLAVVIEVDSALGASEVDLEGDMRSRILTQRLAGPPFEATVEVPTWLEEPFVLIASAESASDPELYGITSITLTIVPDKPLIDIRVLDDMLYFRMPPNVEMRRIAVLGEYADGSTRRIHYPGMGTTYQSSDAGVATVDEEGRVRPVAPGIAFVTVRNSGASDWVPIRVVDAATGVLPPVNQTSKVHIVRSGFRLDLESGLFVQQVTVTNRSSEPLVRPLVLILSDLPPGVTASTTGRKTTLVAPLGSPYQLLGEPLVYQLRPGESIDTEVRFHNPHGVPITYTPSVYTATRP